MAQDTSRRDPHPPIDPEDCRPAKCAECYQDGVASCVHFLDDKGAYVLQRRFRDGTIEDNIAVGKDDRLPVHKQPPGQ